ncbi:hypothetical protein [Bacillus solitudinis]|uniref:hypothetical protein n=1 Tax=Bacillus solitudinis TaxID=2014074 RepID=UPI000C23AFFC|nr:hypothetical protein [Bacillus solitudinis]
MHNKKNKPQSKNTSLFAFILAIYNFHKYKFYSKKQLTRYNILLFLTYIGLILILLPQHLFSTTDVIGIYFIIIIFPQMLKMNKIKRLNR